jgi:hypothetical protein
MICQCPDSEVCLIFAATSAVNVGFKGHRNQRVTCVVRFRTLLLSAKFCRPALGRTVTPRKLFEQLTQPRRERPKFALKIDA